MTPPLHFHYRNFIRRTHVKIVILGKGVVQIFKKRLQNFIRLNRILDEILREKILIFQSFFHNIARILNPFQVGVIFGETFRGCFQFHIRESAEFFNKLFFLNDFFRDLEYSNICSRTFLSVGESGI